MSGFETEARKLRYRALSQACARLYVRRLLLAHHSDDQSESVLMQMLTPGRSALNMRGIPSKGNVPESWGIYGAYESGLEEYTQAANALNESQRRESLVLEPLRYRTKLGIEDGGLMIARPLLGFSKAELRQTCIETRVEWIEDQTNQDPTLTRRNAVRVLLGSGQLPMAMSKSSLLGFGKAQQRMHTELESRGQRLFGTFKVLKFDARDGLLLVRLPPFAASFDGHRTDILLATEKLSIEQKELKQWKSREVALHAVRMLLAIVSPFEKIDKSQLRVAVDSLFPITVLSGQPSNIRTKFTVAGVLCERKDDPAIELSERKDLDQGFTWELSRQPFHHSENSSGIQIPPSISNPDSSAPIVLFREKIYRGEQLLTLPQPQGSPFQLWDGRYWIRVLNRTQSTLLIRHLYPSDLEYLYSFLPPEAASRLRKVLKTAAPDGKRFTLPVIVIPSSDSQNYPHLTPPSTKASNEPVGDIPICLPTLGRTFISPEYCLAEARFRKVDFTPHRPMHKPSAFSAEDYEFVVTRSEPETPEEQAQRREREMYDARRLARNKANKMERKRQRRLRRAGEEDLEFMDGEESSIQASFLPLDDWGEEEEMQQHIGPEEQQRLQNRHLHDLDNGYASQRKDQALTDWGKPRELDHQHIDEHQHQHQRQDFPSTTPPAYTPSSIHTPTQTIRHHNQPPWPTHHLSDLTQSDIAQPTSSSSPNPHPKTPQSPPSHSLKADTTLFQQFTPSKTSKERAATQYQHNQQKDSNPFRRQEEVEEEEEEESFDENAEDRASDHGMGLANWGREVMRQRREVDKEKGKGKERREKKGISDRKMEVEVDREGEGKGKGEGERERKREERWMEREHWGEWL